MSCLSSNFWQLGGNLWHILAGRWHHPNVCFYPYLALSLYVCLYMQIFPFFKTSITSYGLPWWLRL